MSDTAGRPLVSVILPVRNGERFVAEALRSILEQDANCRFQIIVINDGSQDETVEIVSRTCPECILIETPGIGPAAARNAGLERIEGSIIGFIDHDDLWPPQKLAIQLSHLETDPDLDICVGRTQYRFLPGSEKRDIGFHYPEDQSVHHVNLGALLLRRRVIDRIGGFDESMSSSEDFDFMARAREANLKIRPTPELGLIYRLHDSNMTNGRSPADLGIFEMLRRSLRRRRGGQQAATAPQSPS
jgi:glycosyltransferase involved in cell wall biosynthesis